MRKNCLSVAAMLLLGGSTLIADSLEKSFQSGATEGHIGLYGHQFDHKGGAKDGFSNGNASINYETAPFYNVSLGMGHGVARSLVKKTMVITMERLLIRG